MLATKVLKAFVGVLVVPLLAFPQLSYADWGGHHSRPQHYRYQDHPRPGLHVSIIPPGSFTIRLGGSRYFYAEGVYYYRSGRDYVVVAPPVGARVASIPRDYKVVVVNGRRYYTDNVHYYAHGPRGYEVVQQPRVKVVYKR